MWFPSLPSIAVVATAIHLVYASRIEARDGKKTDENAFIEPVGGTVDTTWPVTLRWKPDTKGLITIELEKGLPPDGMEWCETIASNLDNYGTYLWVTGSWLEDSSTMPMGHKYGLKIIDDDTGDYNFSPAFDLIVPHSTYQQHTNYTSDGGIDDDDFGYDDDDYGYNDYDQDDNNNSYGDTKYTYQNGTNSTKDTDEFYPENSLQKDPTIKIGDGSDSLTKPPSDNSISDSASGILSKGKSTSSSTGSTARKGMSTTAKIGVAVAVIAVLVIIGCIAGFLLLRRHKKRQVQKQKYRIGPEGVSSFIAEGRASKDYGTNPQMAQYIPRGGVETRYDPPSGQGLPVVGSTPSDTRYDPPSARHSIETKYDPPR